jgi:hypothetical protein
MQNYPIPDLTGIKNRIKKQYFTAYFALQKNIKSRKSYL